MGGPEIRTHSTDSQSIVSIQTERVHSCDIRTRTLNKSFRDFCVANYTISQYVASLGFEPRTRASKTPMLPLHYEAVHPYSDSNREKQFWRLLCYRYTIRVYVVIEGFEPTLLVFQASTLPTELYHQMRFLPDSNWCRRFCRPEPNHSAKEP